MCAYARAYVVCTCVYKYREGCSSQVKGQSVLKIMDL